MTTKATTPLSWPFQALGRRAAAAAQRLQLGADGVRVGIALPGGRVQALEAVAQAAQHAQARAGGTERNSRRQQHPGQRGMNARFEHEIGEQHPQRQVGPQAAQAAGS